MLFLKQLEPILQCPVTGNDVFFDVGSSVVRVRESDITYPIRDGIVDLMPGVADAVSKIYDDMAGIYDSYITSSNISMRMLNVILWGFRSDHQYAEKVVSLIPDDLDSVLLDIPVGTGILTANKYRTMANVKIIAVDCSFEMLRKAKDIYDSNGVRNAVLVRANVANLPIKNSKIGSVLSMNGFHAFSQKDSAAAELNRVLTEGGNLVGCLYVKGKRLLSDLVVDAYLSRQGAFSPPFFFEDDFLRLFERSYDVEFRDNLKSFLYFKLVKRFS